MINIARSLLIWLAFAQAVSGATSTNLPPPPAASAVELQRQMAAHLAAPRFNTAQWGVKVVSLESGNILFEHRTDQYFSPASNTKLFTTALALDKFGPNYRIKTSILASSRPDASGRLPGDLIIFGRGDPTLNPRVRGGTISKALDLFVNAIKSAGVKQIDGDLIGDESYFKGPPFGSGWAIDDLQSYYGAEISALTFNDNTLELSVKPASQVGAPAILSLSVPNSLVILSNRVTTVAKGSKTAVELYRPIGENLIYVSGTIAMDGTFEEEITLHRPAGLFVELLREALVQQNIAVTGQSRVMNWKDREGSPLALPNLIELGAVESLPLSDILREIQKPSQNLYTDLLLAHVGEVTRTKAGTGLTSEEAGIVALNTFLPKAGIKKSDVLFEEGSGLSRNNLVTPNAIVSLLTYMRRQPTATVYFDALPVAGVDGTLRNRFKKTPAEGNLRAKTGSLRWASSLSGTLTNAAGEPLVFSIMVNRYNNPDPDHSARAEIDALSLLIARSTFRTKPEANPPAKPRAEAADDALAGEPGLDESDSQFDADDPISLAGQRVAGILREIENQFAPDKTNDIFDVSLQRNNHSVSAHGSVESTEAKSAVLDALSPLFGRIDDNITVRPRSERTNGWGIVLVSVANLRLEPNHRAEMGTQALLGTVIRILRKSSNWYYAQTPEGYRSWIEAGHFIPCDRAIADAWEASNRIFVTEWMDRIREKPNDKALPVSDVVAGSLLKKIGTSGSFYKVELPDQRVGFLPKQSGMDYNEWKKKTSPSADNIEQTARHLVGVPYMWGGTSPKALDCSGFTKTVFLLNGLQLNRDARHQAHQGLDLDPGQDFENLRKGDLLFFGRKGTSRAPEQITHVAIYLEDRKFIHAASMVKYNSLDPASPLFDEKRLKTFVRARRILADY